MAYTAGIDIGGTNVKFGVVDEENRLVHVRRLPSILGDPEAMLALIEVELAASPFPVARVGVGAPGSVRMPGGIVHSSNLRWYDVPLLRMMRERLALPCWVDNDAETAMAAEWSAGVLKGLQTAVYLTLGTGIGGALLIEGKPWRGHDNRAGELGHIITHADGLRCPCGRRGCFEVYGSATALARMAGGLNARAVMERAQAGDAAMLRALSHYAHELAIGLASLHMAFRPQAIVLGGGISAAGDLLLTPIRDAIRALSERDAPSFEDSVCFAALKNDAGMLGAAALARLNAT